MAQRLQELERKLATLPEAQQEQWISHFLDELATDAAVEAIVTDSHQWINGRKPSQKKVAEAVEQLRQLRVGKRLGDDLTTKELIDEGRRS